MNTTVVTTTLEALAGHDWDEIAIPFVLGDIRIDRVLRHLPGKRIAGHAFWNGQEVFVKLFFGSTVLASREKALLERLQQAGFSVPRILDYLELEKGRILITEWLDAGLLDREPLEQTLPAIIDMILQLADLGLVQKDLHLNNFLWTEGQLRLIDAGDISDCSKDKTSAILNSLVMLCAQLPLHQTKAGLAIIEQQMASRIDIASARFAKAVRDFQNRRIRRMIKKWQRASSAIALQKMPEGILLKDRLLSADTSKKLLEAIENLHALPVIKQGSKVTLYQVDDQWIIKHYFHTSLKTRLKRLLFAGRADISWKMGWTLDYLGIPTPKPVLLLRYFDSQELIVFPLIQGKPLGSLLEQTGMAEQPGATRAKYWLDLMHQQGIWHGDTKAFNCLLDEKGEVWWIDLDAAGQSRFQTISRFFTGRDTRRWRQNFFP